jgi:hypothetical protein
MSDSAPGSGAGPAPDRYGRVRRGPSRRVVVPLAVGLLGVGVGFAAYATWVTDRHPKAKVSTFETSESGVRVTTTIRRDPGRTTECALRARNDAGAEVGRRTLVIPPGESRSVTLTEFLETRERPVTGEVRDCRSTG